MKYLNHERKVIKQIAIDEGLHNLLKLKATASRKSLKAFVEGYFAEVLEVEPKEQSE